MKIRKDNKTYIEVDKALRAFEKEILMGTVPGECTTPGCDNEKDVEPDCREGYCEMCQQFSVVSSLILYGGLE